MRLIDADELTKGRVENDPVVIAAKCTPTAYDVDEVIKQLEEKYKTPRTDYDEGTNYICGIAIEIVKAGGVCKK